MIERIAKNEERFDRASISIEKLQEALKEFQENQKDISSLERYYGSKNWFHDKEAYENHRISNVKAGVLSEDAVWNLLEEMDDVLLKMQKIVSYYEKKKKDRK